jgi:hypothetical protein
MVDSGTIEDRVRPLYRILSLMDQKIPEDAEKEVREEKIRSRLKELGY